MHIGVVGAGLAGRLSAYLLSQKGHRVTVFESSSRPDPAASERRAAAWTSAGMLSPTAEMESGGVAVRDLGRKSLAMWKEIHHTAPLGLELNDSLMVCHAQDIASAQRILSLLEDDAQSIIRIDAKEIRSFAPEIKGTLHAWRLLGEGHLHPARAMQSLMDGALHTQWNFGEDVREVLSGCVVSRCGRQSFDWVIDARGTGAANDLPVRGVRGELVVLHAPGFTLERPVRLLHPRWRVYLVPRPNEQLVVGATEIESEDLSPISVQSALELLSAAFSIFPSLAEARILHTDVNLRPATRDNLPLAQTRDGLTHINGLFRHGWLLAPALISDSLSDARLL